MEAKEIIDDLEYMKKYGEFFKYQHQAIDEAIALIKEYQSPEIQRLIEIGKAVELLGKTSYGGSVFFGYFTGPNESDFKEILSIDELL